MILNNQPSALAAQTGGYGLDLMNMNYSPAMYNYFNPGYTANAQQSQNPTTVSAYHQQMLSAQQMNNFG